MTMRTPPLLMMKQADIGFPACMAVLDKMYIIEWQMQVIVLNSPSHGIRDNR
jgi:hypothetical protein